MVLVVELNGVDGGDGIGTGVSGGGGVEDGVQGGSSSGGGGVLALWLQ